MSIFELWLLSCVFKLSNVGAVALTLSAIAAGTLGLPYLITVLEQGKEAASDLLKAIKLLTVIGLVALCVYTVVPDKEEALWIAGGHIATNIDGVGDIPENAVKAVNAFLESVTEKED